jgi:hypothetical protein
LEFEESQENEEAEESIKDQAMTSLAFDSEE